MKRQTDFSAGHNARDTRFPFENHAQPPYLDELCYSCCGNSRLNCRGITEHSLAAQINLSSALYGTAALPEILPEVAKTGATLIDLWPQPHSERTLKAVVSSRSSSCLKNITYDSAA